MLKAQLNLLWPFSLVNPFTRGWVKSFLVSSTPQSWGEIFASSLRNPGGLWGAHVRTPLYLEPGKGGRENSSAWSLCEDISDFHCCYLKNTQKTQNKHNESCVAKLPLTSWHPRLSQPSATSSLSISFLKWWLDIFWLHPSCEWKQWTPPAPSQGDAASKKCPSLSLQHPTAPLVSLVGSGGSWALNPSHFRATIPQIQPFLQKRICETWRTHRCLYKCRWSNASELSHFTLHFPLKHTHKPLLLFVWLEIGKWPGVWMNCCRGQHTSLEIFGDLYKTRFSCMTIIFTFSNTSLLHFWTSNEGENLWIPKTTVIIRRIHEAEAHYCWFSALHMNLNITLGTNEPKFLKTL